MPDTVQTHAEQEPVPLSVGQQRYLKGKRVLDVILSLAALVVLAPLFALIAIAIKLESPGEPVLFCQARVGRLEKAFRLYKFRSMKSEAPSALSTTEFVDSEDYITRVGRFLRRTSLDELPQLWNVLLGQMSLIGPRPLVSREETVHYLRQYYGIYRLRPGMTGLAQIHGRDALDDLSKVWWDRAYLRGLGLRMDLSVCLHSVAVVLRHTGVLDDRAHKADGQQADLCRLSDKSRVRHVFVVGSKGLPARYGGFETFVENLTAGKISPALQYHVSCMARGKKAFVHNGAECFPVAVPLPGAPGRILHVGLVLFWVERWLRSHPGTQAVVYILGCRVGPLLIPHARVLRRLGAQICCNPDGLEWKRSKWSAPAKRFLQYCEQCLVKNSDLVICDSQNIERYIRQTYPAKQAHTRFVAYGAWVRRSACTETQLQAWYADHSIRKNGYYLVVGRFVPENNYETMLTEFMASGTAKDLVIIANVQKNRFYRRLAQKTGFERDGRIKFVGTVYDPELLKKIREEAYGYLHGHEVGGTNPSLLEALAATRLNLLLDVGFNREVAGESALYWTKAPGALAQLLAQTDLLAPDEIARRDQASTARVTGAYQWPDICRTYESIFLAGSAAGPA